MRRWRTGRAEWAMAGVLLGLTGLMFVYPQSTMFDLAGEALAVGFYIGRRPLLHRQ